jgi:hypothetical protein
MTKLNEKVRANRDWNYNVLKYRIRLSKLAPILSAATSGCGSMSRINWSAVADIVAQAAAHDHISPELQIGLNALFNKGIEQAFVDSHGVGNKGTFSVTEKSFELVTPNQVKFVAELHHNSVGENVVLFTIYFSRLSNNLFGGIVEAVCLAQINELLADGKLVSDYVTYRDYR